MNYRIPTTDYLIVLFLTLFLATLFHNPLTILGLGFFIFLFILFFREVNHRLPVELMVVLMSGLQWVVAPALSYRMGIDHWKYHMYIPENEYMSLAVPGLIIFYLGMRILQRKRYERDIIQELFQILPGHIRANPWFPMALVITGLFFTYFYGRLPGSLQFVGYLLSGLKYIGLVYFIFLRWKNGILVGLLILSLTIYTSLRAGMFHEFLLWIIFIGMYLVQIVKPGVTMKGISVAGLILTILIIQLVKQEYRQLLWAGKVKSGYVNTYTDLVKENLENQELTGTSNIEATVIRINQGWIISRIISRVPDIEPYANGSTIKDAINAAIAPRLINPNKKKASGKENYERFTGFTLLKTAMGISLLGEGYANFGRTGALVFLFCMGIFYSLFIRLVYGASRLYPSLILWFPLLLFHAVKAESELLSILNYMVKSFVLVMLLFWGFSRVLGIKL